MARRGRPRKGEEKEKEKEGVEPVPLEKGSMMPMLSDKSQNGMNQTLTQGATTYNQTTAPAETAEKVIWSEEVEEVGPNPPREAEGKGRNWVDVVRGNHEKENGWALEYKPLEINQKVVVITPEERAEGCENWRFALVGFTLGIRSGFRELKIFAASRWRGRGLPTTHMLQNGVVLFNFPDLDARDRALEGNWTVRGHPLILRPWTPKLDFQKLDVEKVPVWVQFPGLPLSLWTPRILSKIASYLGVPLATDKLTACKERFAYARVLIDMKINSELVYQVPVETEDGAMLQEVYYEWSPLKCKRCKSYGHNHFQCSVSEVKAWVLKIVVNGEVLEAEASNAGDKEEERMGCSDPGASTPKPT